MSDIKPLTVEEWSGGRLTFVSEPRLVLHDDGDGLECVVYDGPEYLDSSVADKLKVADWDNQGRHAIAVLALHGQPFGFSREDVALLRKWHGLKGIPAFADLAERIAALLPPEDTK